MGAISCFFSLHQNCVCLHILSISGEGASKRLVIRKPRKTNKSRPPCHRVRDYAGMVGQCCSYSQCPAMKLLYVSALFKVAKTNIFYSPQYWRLCKIKFLLCCYAPQKNKYFSFLLDILYKNII